MTGATGVWSIAFLCLNRSVPSAHSAQGKGSPSGAQRKNAYSAQGKGFYGNEEKGAYSASRKSTQSDEKRCS